MTFQALQEQPGLYALAAPVTAEQIISMAEVLLAEQHKRGEAMVSPQIVQRALRMKYGALEHEAFGVVWLDTQHRIIDEALLFRGTIDGASVYPREVVKEALAHNAQSVIFFHNHPSGHAEPSRADQAITERLKNALALVDVKVLDHIIVSPTETVSFAERGLI